MSWRVLQGGFHGWLISSLDLSGYDRTIGTAWWAVSKVIPRIFKYCRYKFPVRTGLCAWEHTAIRRTKGHFQRGPQTGVKNICLSVFQPLSQSGMQSSLSSWLFKCTQSFSVDWFKNGMGYMSRHEHIASFKESSSTTCHFNSNFSFVTFLVS